MAKKDFHVAITVNTSAAEALKKVSQINLWWSKKVTGNAKKINDVSTIHFGDRFVKFKLSEVIPDKKIVWRVTDCYHWVTDKEEWVGTDVMFDITEKDGKTTVTFTHKGLVPDVECYDECVDGWTHYIKGSVFNLLTTGKGLPW